MPTSALALSHASTLNPAEVSGPAGAPRLAGPGWFESSWDLRRGLEVSETWPADAPLAFWIEGFLGAQGAWSAAGAGVSFSAT
jgi:hypothetical protein